MLSPAEPGKESGIFWHMMPRLPSLVLRRSGGGAVLLALIALGLVLPARHVVLPPWPDPVDEVLAEGSPGRIERHFLSADAPVSVDSLVVARSRPITLWRLETDSGEVLHAWLAGLRDGEGTLLPALPAWLQAARLDGPLPEAVRLVVITASRDSRELEGEDIVRMYRPNDMTLAQRAGLWRDRLDERWEWPFRMTGDARMTPRPR